MHGKTPRASPPRADELFNSVHLWRRDRDGNEESTDRICDEVRRIAANIAKLPLLTCPRNLIQPAPLSRVSGQETTPPIPSPKFPVREAPLAPVARGFLLPPIRNKALNGATAGRPPGHPTATAATHRVNNAARRDQFR
jgi:hypothetical protein